jgi:hypothetical protein
MVNPKIHIFCCGNELGFSLRETGDDLPSPNAGKWVRFRSAELDSDFLRQLPVDAMMLLRDIVGRGHHVTSQLDQPFLPSAHRQSA